MSFRRAVELIVSDMEADVDNMSKIPAIRDGGAFLSLRTYFKMLQMALTAAGAEETVQKPSLTHQDLIAREREKMRAAKGGIEAQEKLEPIQVTAVGGKLDGDLIPIPRDMPVGARAPIGDEVYERRDDGNLHVCESFL